MNRKQKEALIIALTEKGKTYREIVVIDDNADIVFTLRVGLESDPTMQVIGYDNPVTALVEFKTNFNTVNADKMRFR
jgi:hypothetical protein